MLKKNNSKKIMRIPQMISLLALVILLIMVYYPILLMVIKSFKTIEQEIHNPFTISFPFNFANYELAWLYVNPYILNTFYIAVPTTLGVVFACSSMAYGFTRYKFPFKNTLFMMVLALMMVPGMLTLIPQYVMVKNMDLVNNRFGVILPLISGSIPFGVLLLKTFFSGLSEDLFCAADLDGASSLRKYFIIALPLSMPILATLGLTTFLNSWNDLVWSSLILRRDQFQTITVALNSFTTNYYNTTNSYGVPLAGYVIVSAPLIIVFAFTSKQFINGLTSGAFKM